MKKFPVPVSVLREETVKNYPFWAIRELLMNAVMHRDYESNTPVRFYQYRNRIELMNAGGLFGNARPENFPNVNDYRNPVIAEAMKVLGYVNRFSRGVARVREELIANCREGEAKDRGVHAEWRRRSVDQLHLEASIGVDARKRFTLHYAKTQGWKGCAEPS